MVSNFDSNQTSGSNLSTSELDQPPDQDPPPGSNSSSTSGSKWDNWPLQAGLALLGIGLFYGYNFLSENFTAGGLFDQGVALQNARNCDEAIAKFDKALRYNSSMVAAYHARAICHVRLDHLDKALSDYSEAIRLKPDSVEDYYNRGLVYRAKGDSDRALGDWEAAIRLSPADSDARMRRAEVLRDRDDFDGAINEYDILIGLRVNEPESRMRRAEVLRDKGEFNAALVEYETVMRIKPDDASAAFFARAATLRDKGATEAALIDVEKGIQRWPDFASGYMERGLIELFHTNKPAAAAADFAKAIDLGFKYRQAMILLDTGAEAVGVVVTDRRPKLAPDTPFVPAAYDLIVQLHLARARAGQRDREELAENARNLSD